MSKKVAVIVILGILIGTSVVTSPGQLAVEQLIPPAERTTHSPSFWGSASFLKSQNELMLLPPTIAFPLPGEVFRTGDIVWVNGTASMPEFDYYTLTWGVGLAPTEWFTDGITLMDNGTHEVINGSLGFWDTASVTAAGYYTIQLTIHLIDAEQYTANANIYLDPTLHQNFPFGWPHEIQGSQVTIWSPIACSDINHDGYQEIGFGTVTVVPPANNYDYVIDHNGDVLPGWPNQCAKIQGAAVTFANIINATSSDEVIGGMWGEQLFVWYDNGTVVEGWPQNVLSTRSSVAVNDIDGDSDLEIILPSTDGGQVYVFHHDGTMANGWPVSIGSPIRSAVATADIDQDGFPEIIFGDEAGYVHVLHKNGSVVDGWPQLAHDFIKSSPVIADLEGDGDLEVIICSGFTQLKIVSAYHHDGTLVSGWPQENGLPFAQPSVGDIDGNGDLEILAGGQISGTPYGRFYAWHHDGTVVSGFPIIFDYDGSGYYDFIYAQPVIGDIDGDADVEIIAGSYHKKLYAWHHDATPVAGWPKVIGDAVDSTAMIADIDADTLVEVAVAGDDGKIYVWDLGGIYNASRMEWPQYQYDASHTGCYQRKPGTNRPPETPAISGLEKGKVRVATDYNVTTRDPDGDEVYYFIDWGDGTNSSWIGPVPSGEIIVRSHTWYRKGTYMIQAKAKDILGAESDWGTLSVIMPRTYDIPHMQFWERLFTRFPHAFPILRHFMGY